MPAVYHYVTIENVGALIVELWCDCHRQSTYSDSLRSATRPCMKILRIRIGFGEFERMCRGGRVAERSESKNNMIAGGNHTIMQR